LQCTIKKSSYVRLRVTNGLVFDPNDCVFLHTCGFVYFSQLFYEDQFDMTAKNQPIERSRRLCAARAAALIAVQNCTVAESDNIYFWAKDSFVEGEKLVQITHDSCYKLCVSAKETSYHFVAECPKYCESRFKKFWKPILDPEDMVISSKNYVTVARLVSFLYDTKRFNVEEDTIK